MTAWTDVIGWTLVHFLWEGTVVALVCAGLLRVLRQASAHVRYVVACAGLRFHTSRFIPVRLVCSRSLPRVSPACDPCRLTTIRWPPCCRHSWRSGRRASSY